MRIGWIGGVERREVELSRMAASAGHELEFHSGNVHGRGSHDLRALVERSELVIIVTEVNSHGGVLLAKRLTRRLGRGSLVVNRLGGARFKRLLEALVVRDLTSPVPR